MQKNISRLGTYLTFVKRLKKKMLGPSDSNSIEAGSSLISVLIAAVIVGVIAMVSSQVLVNSRAGMKATEMQSDINAIRKNIMDNFDCAKSLGSPTALPLSCSSFSSIPILRANGSSVVGAGGKVGVCTIAAGCSNNHIVFTASKSG